jgi:ethanolamine ammonia-lyase large subunit
MAYQHSVKHHTYRFNDLKALLAKATPHRSGDALAGIFVPKATRNAWPPKWPWPMYR